MLLVNYYAEIITQLVWKNIFKMLFFHSIALFAVFEILRGSAKLHTLLFDYVLAVFTFLSFTAGNHRLWAHRSYKARWPLRLFLVCLNFLMYGNPAISWAIEHRTHHKYSETDADPHDARRGLFFSQIGWMMLKQKPEVLEKTKGIDKSDLYSDPILRWQKKYYVVFMPLGAFILPTFIPMYYWNETFTMAYSINILRYLTVFHVLGLINSVAHAYGDKPYDRHISPGDSRCVSALTLGEGLHNFHHTFPSDYRSAELGMFSFNITQGFIDFCAKIGLAYDRKTTSPEMIKKRAARTGNRPQPKDLSEKDDYKDTEIINRS